MADEDEDYEGAEAPSGPEDEERGRRRQFERLLRDSIRRTLEKGLEAGLGTISRTDKAIRGVVSSELPREAVGFVFQQIDETKNVIVGTVAREVREFLERADLATEIQRVLTSLSFEVRTEIRFIPNEAGGIRPKVRSRAVPKRARGSEPPGDEPGSGSTMPPPPEDA